MTTPPGGPLAALVPLALGAGTLPVTPVAR
jgi:hypothetical protein